MAESVLQHIDPRLGDLLGQADAHGGGHHGDGERQIGHRQQAGECGCMDGRIVVAPPEGGLAGGPAIEFGEKIVPACHGRYVGE